MSPGGFQAVCNHSGRDSPGQRRVLVPLCLDLGGEKSWPWVLAGFPRIMRMARRMLLQLEAWLWTKHDSGADSLLNAFNGLLTLHQL